MDLNILKENLDKYLTNEKFEHEIWIEQDEDGDFLRANVFWGALIDDVDFDFSLGLYTYNNSIYSTYIDIAVEHISENVGKILSIDRNEKVEELLNEYNFLSYCTKVRIAENNVLSFESSFSIEGEEEICQNLDDIITELCGVEELFPIMKELKKYCKPKK